MGGKNVQRAGFSREGCCEQRGRVAVHLARRCGSAPLTLCRHHARPSYCKETSPGPHQKRSPRQQILQRLQQPKPPVGLPQVCPFFPLALRLHAPSFATFLCLQCAGTHRGFGVHIRHDYS